MSVSQRRFGPSAWKSRFAMFSGASPISPLQELCLRLLGRLAMSPSSFVIRQTTFSDTAINRI